MKEQEGKHTPGPWGLDERYPGNVYSDDATGAIVAKCGPFDFVSRSPEEVKANACLIADAPALLDALEAMEASARPNPVEHPAMTEAWNAARALLRKHGRLS